MIEGRNNHGKSVGLVHDYLLVMRGAERTFAAIADCWSEAPIYTLLFDPAETSPPFDQRRVTPSYLQRLRIRQNGFRRLLPLFPRAVERLPVQDHDLIISSSSAFAHGVRPREGAVHVCYCHSPFRYVYFSRKDALSEIPALARPFMDHLLTRAGRWDSAASMRVDHYIANSELSRQRIADYYERDASVIHPPVEVERFRPGHPEDFFLVVTQLVRHKHVELALEGARLAGKRVKVVGDGPDLLRLKELYSGNAEFLGHVSDQVLNDLYQRTCALIVPNVEEFGIAMVEAQAAGRPVIAADDGGAQEIVIPGKTGELVPVGNVDAMAEAMREIDFNAYSTPDITANAARFSKESFCRKLAAEVDRMSGLTLSA